ncbi:piggyBac transposable element-derived protein 4-like isoform 2-T2 [Clarias gariepinus]|uniref:piggyBac transposable element-derived protein 4-like isoform X2 n=1 Tax=Clarias gariepinus TaxID=13013 RepID=UPI00234DB3BB|nr:piggyBac transposable element-derived protein 4-like isoform X2 [Clarias gariepinus]
MARYTAEKSPQVAPDSEEEFSGSSDEDYDSDDEQLHFEERIDPTEENPANCSDDSDSENDQPVRKKARKNKQAKYSQSTMSWKTETEADTIPQTLRFLPAREPGPQLRSADSHSPMSLFKQFFSERAVSTLCDNTNAQAAKATAKGHKYKWTDVGITEMYHYIGLVFYMAMVKLPSIQDYWRQSSIFTVPFPAKVMSRERYRTISWNVHMSHPDADKENDKKRGTSEHDRLFRVKPLMDTLRLACKTIYHPRRNLTVNERVVACKAHTGIRAKPTTFGFKLFVLADSSNGYTVDFSVYTGKNNFPSGHGLSYDAVTSLLDRKVLGSGYHVYMDSFFTSPKLLKDLLTMKFGACGTYRDNRKDCPRNADNSLSNESARGSIRWIRDGPLVFVKWMDTQEVSVCSTIHSAYTGDTVQRKMKSQGTWRTKKFPCPAPVTAYNRHMVDLSGQLLQYYTAQHKTMKWYRKIFLHFLDIAATNTFIVHKELHGDVSHKEFMEQLITELCGVSQKVAPKRVYSDHVPVSVVDLSSDARNVASDGRRMCVVCKTVYAKRQKTPWKCQACDVCLCLQLNRNCFQEWHRYV